MMVRAQMSIVQPGVGGAAPGASPDSSSGGDSGSGGSSGADSSGDGSGGGSVSTPAYTIGDGGGSDVVGSVSAATGAKYSDLAEKGNPFAAYYAGLSANETAEGDTGTTREYEWLFGSDATAEQVNKRIVCKRGCVDPTIEVNLVWCANAVKYSFCNRVSGTPETMVRDMENGAISAYMALVRKVPTPEAEECKTTLRAWMCYEFFNRCNNDGTEFYPVCKTTCAAAKYACGSPTWIDCDQEVEELEGSAPAAWYTKEGLYIRGLKPDGQLGNPVFEADALRCTGAGGRKFGVEPGRALFLAALIACVAASLASSRDHR